MEECKQHSGITAQLAELQKDKDEQWDAINALRNRLPTWATIVISLLTFLLGCSVTLAALASRLSNGK